MAATPTKVPILIIEGNIGVGKSTLLRGMRDADPLAGTENYYIEEEVDPQLLQQFYDGELNKTSFQIAILTQRYRKLLEAYVKGAKKVIIDRYIYGDLAFAMANIKNPNDFKAYFAHWKDLKDHLERCFDISCVFIQAPSAQFLLDNIQKRGRESERSISADYLNEIENLTHTCVVTFCTGNIVYAVPEICPE